MITTIIFDLAEVILRGFYGVEHIIAKEVVLPPDVVKQQTKGPEFRPLMEGRITEEEFWDGMRKRNNWPVDTAFLKQAIRDNFGEIAGTRAIIERLKAKGYRLGLLSDHAREWIDHCHSTFDFHKLFDSRQYSFEVGCTKQSPNTFKLLLKKLGEQPEHCLFIDDREKNLVVAKSVGLDTIQFKDAEQLRLELEKRNIL